MTFFTDKSKLQRQTASYAMARRDVLGTVHNMVQLPSLYFDLGLGQHPQLVFTPSGMQHFDGLHDVAKLSSWQDAGIPLALDPRGHHMLADITVAGALGVDPAQPIAPLFVRDLASRVVYTGVSNPIKQVADWHNDEPFRFPVGCSDVTDQVAGADLIESTFFLNWRILRMSRSASGEQVFYDHPEAYPYKIRLDTFYQDGWRLPQTEMLYVRPVEDLAAADTLGQALLTKWEGRPDSQTYEAFYAENDGDTWFETLFLQGCTVIPTLEAANGYNVVNDKFELEDYRPGCAVEGLHHVVTERDSDHPAGTILEVVQPGFVTGTKVSPAHVVVSNGSGYRVGNADALLPDLNLPHPRVSAEWGACWLPTKPSHFEAPTIWGWDVGQAGNATGHFMQRRGPVWDPLHYYYASFDQIRRAMRTPLEDNLYSAPVPEVMKQRFYPMIPMVGYDSYSQHVYEQRKSHGTWPMTGLDRLFTGEQSCGVGYHPLPLCHELELDSFAFPELAPQNRVPVGAENVDAGRLAPLIKSTVTAAAFQQRLVAPDGSGWLQSADDAEGGANPLIAYTQLQRYVGSADEAEQEDLILKHVPLHLAKIPEHLYEFRPHELLRAVDTAEFLQKQGAQWPDTVHEYVLECRRWRQFRYETRQDHAGWYALAQWMALTPQQLKQQLAESNIKGAEKLPAGEG